MNSTTIIDITRTHSRRIKNFGNMKLIKNTKQHKPDQQGLVVFLGFAEVPGERNDLPLLYEFSFFHPFVKCHRDVILLLGVPHQF